jgi:hypothetical protein
MPSSVSCPGDWFKYMALKREFRFLPLLERDSEILFMSMKKKLLTNKFLLQKSNENSDEYKKLNEKN